jgi:hypothetical protein
MNIFKRPERLPIDIHQSKPYPLSPFESFIKRYSNYIIKILINKKRK